MKKEYCVVTLLGNARVITPSRYEKFFDTLEGAKEALEIEYSDMEENYPDSHWDVFIENKNGTIIDY